MPAHMNRLLILLSLAALLAAPTVAQDKVTLSNGDVLSGKLGTMAEGKLTIKSPVLGDVVVPFEQVATIATQGPVEIVTKSGERVKRRIVGIDLGKLQLAAGEEGGPAAPTITLDQVNQLNPPEKKPATWTGSLTVNALFAEGNTDSRTVGLSLEAVQRRENDRINFDAAWDYGEDKVLGVWQLNQRRTGAGIKYDYFLSKRLYALATTRALGDTMADLDLRFSAGAGLGYQLVETETLGVLIEAGPSYFREDYRSPVPSVDYLAARCAYKVTWAMTDTTRIIHGIEAFPSLERHDDIYFNMNTKLQLDFTKSMFAQMEWVWDYDNTPSPGRDRSDNRYIVSVGWKF
jgi:putative salt-induced outer membrane protein YdiY